MVKCFLEDDSIEQPGFTIPDNSGSYLSTSAEHMVNALPSITDKACQMMITDT